jgi:hypothetical protein
MILEYKNRFDDVFRIHNVSKIVKNNNGLFIYFFKDCIETWAYFWSKDDIELSVVLEETK